MKSLKDTIANDFERFGIKGTKKEPCDVCGDGSKITVMMVDGTELVNCKFCNDKVKSKEWGLPQSKEDSVRMRTSARARHFNRIPLDLEGVKLNNYRGEKPEQEKAKQEAIDFVVNFKKGRSLVMSGKAGVGKSHIAVSIANALKDDYSVMFLKSNDILSIIQESYNGSEHSEQDLLDACAEVDLLIIDDLGAEYSKASDSESWAGTKLFSVLDSRLGKSVIVTTNYSESQIVEKFGMNGERIVSRMNDGAELMRIVGNDGRRKQ